MLRILTNAVGARKNAALNRHASRLSGRTSGLKLRQLLKCIAGVFLAFYKPLQKDQPREEKSAQTQMAWVGEILFRAG